MVSQKIPQLQAQARDQLGTRKTVKIRATGKLPAVIYGHKLDPVHITIDKRQITDLLNNHAHLVEVVVDSKTEPCLIKDIQWNHLGTEIKHLDLTRVDLTEKVSVAVDLELTGEAVGLKESGAILQHPTNEIEVHCLATQIPERITLDISELKVGDTLTIADLKLPNGVTTKMDPEMIIASIQILGEEVEEETAEGTAAEPEVIGAKKEDKPENESK